MLRPEIADRMHVIWIGGADYPHKIAVYESVDAHFILNDLYARLKYQYGES